MARLSEADPEERQARDRVEKVFRRRPSSRIPRQRLQARPGSPPVISFAPLVCGCFCRGGVLIGAELAIFSGEQLRAVLAQADCRLPDGVKELCAPHEMHQMLSVQWETVGQGGDVFAESCGWCKS